MHLIRARWLLGLGLLLFSGWGARPARAEWSLRAGLGYEYLSQQYFLDSLGSTSSDTLATVTALTTTYLDDLKGQLALVYRPLGDRRLEFSGSYEQTPDQLRTKLAGEFHPEVGSAKLDGTAELDVRRSFEARPDPGDEYVYGYARTKLMLPIREHAYIWWHLRGEFVRFDSAGSYAFDHVRGGGNFGLREQFGGFSSLDASVFVMSRSVPDSTRLSYLSYGLESSFFGFYAGGEIDAISRFEIRDYNSPGDTADYRRVELYARHRLDLGNLAFSRQEIDFEATWFDQPDEINGDYGRFRLSLLGGLDNQTVSAALGPRIELLWQQGDISYSEAYNEWGMESQIDIVMPGRLFGSLESTSGRRDVKDESSEDVPHSDFVFERVNLLADITLTAGLSLNGLVSAEWEWHRLSEENSRLFLVSSGFSYSF